MLAISEGSFSNGTQAGEFSASVYLPKTLVVLPSARKVEFNSVQNVGQNLSRLSQMAIRECGRVRRFLRSNVDRSRVIANMRDETRGWLHNA